VATLEATTANLLRAQVGHLLKTWCASVRQKEKHTCLVLRADPAT